MMTVVVILVAIAAGQGIYNMLRESHKEFELIDPQDSVSVEEVGQLNRFERKAA
jgi:hypothetical protein